RNCRCFSAAPSSLLPVEAMQNRMKSSWKLSASPYRCKVFVMRFLLLLDVGHAAQTHVGLRSRKRVAPLAEPWSKYFVFAVLVATRRDTHRHDGVNALVHALDGVQDSFGFGDRRLDLDDA